MKIARLAAALAAAAALSAAGAARAEPLVFLPPVGDDAEATALGDLMHARAERLLIEGGAPAVTSLRHVLGAAEAVHASPQSWMSGPAADRIARLLGVGRVVAGRLHGARGGYTLELVEIDHGKPGASTTITLPAPLADAVAAGAGAIATLVRGRPAGRADGWPPGVPDRAVAGWAQCHAAVARQPIQLDSPSIVHTDELKRAVAACREALSLAPALDGAKASLGLALAISDQAPEAADVLSKVPTTSYDPSLFLAHYWLATRYRSADAGLAILREAARRFPGSLLARVTLAEHLYVTRQNDAALVSWNEVLALAPESPLTRSRVSAVLARLGRHDQAIALAKGLAALSPGDSANGVVLATRYIDAGRNPEAIAVLEPLAVDGASPKVYERLGRAYLHGGQLVKAQHAFERARDESDRTAAEWRTRGYAFAGLLRVAAARRDDAAALEVAAQAKDEGFVPFLRALNDATVSSAVDRLDAKDRGPNARVTRVEGPRRVRPAEATPFALDPAGEVDPRGRAYQSPPSFMQVLRF